MNWRIYYADGSTWGPEDGPPQEAPAWGVVCVSQDNPTVGSEVWNRHDYYVLTDDGWIGMDLIGLIDHWARMGVVKMGRCIETETYREICARAYADAEKKSELPRGVGNNAGSPI